MTELPRAIAQKLRRRCGVGKSRCPVEVAPGDAPPLLTGEAGRNEFKNGGRVDHPRAAMASGHKVYYVRSTLRIVVGDEWLAVELDCPDALAARIGLRPDTPLGVMADYAEEHGLPVNVERLRRTQITAGGCR